MSEEKRKLVVGLCVAAVTKHLMEHYSISHADAYEKLMGTEFFTLLNDPKTSLIYEPEGYLYEACILELEQGKEAMYDYIKNL